MPSARILELPRGPTIEGTRITVYSILEYLDAGWTPERLVEPFPILTPEQIQAACEYAYLHAAELRPELEAMQERDRRGNPPELQARLDAHAGAARRLRTQTDGVTMSQLPPGVNGVHPG